MSSAVGSWTRYWFRPVPLFNLAVCRIAVVGFQLWLWWRLSTDLFRDLSALPDSSYAPLPVLSFLTWPFGLEFRPSLEFAMVAYGITLAAGVLALIGLRTNLSLLVFAVGSIFIQSFIYSFGDYHHPEALTMIALFVLALSPSGRALSVDDLWRRIRTSTRDRQFRDTNSLDEKDSFASWPILLIQWLFALVYLDSAISKLGMGGSDRIGLDWVNGYTLQYHLIDEGMRYGTDSAMWLGQQHLLVTLMSWASLLFEASFFLVVLFPVLAVIYLPLGIAFHTGIYFTLNAPFFQWLVLYAVFIPWAPLLRTLGSRLALRGLARRPELHFDTRCTACVRSATAIRYFDWFDRLAYSGQPGGTQPGVHLVRPDISDVPAPNAYRQILRQIPLLWPALAASYIPGASSLGGWVMRLLNFWEGHSHSDAGDEPELVESRAKGTALRAQAAEGEDGV